MWAAPLARRARPTKRRRPKTPITVMAIPATRMIGVSLPRPVAASEEEPLPMFPVDGGLLPVSPVDKGLPVFPVDEGLLTTAATGDVVVVVDAAPTLEAGTVVVVVAGSVVVVVAPTLE